MVKTFVKIDLKNIFNDDGLLDKNLKNYEHRPQQIKMAEAIQEAIEKKCHLIVEAGTGIGKTIAYLVPFIFWSKENKKRIIISTYTKTLQEQIAKKDLPFLQKTLPVDFKFALCVGSENYICLRRLSRYYRQGLFDNKDTLERILKWVKQTQTGLKLEINFFISGEFWQSICRESDLCLGKKCIHSRKQCFYTKSKLKQQRADILVANHHLFFTDIASGNRVLPGYDAIVFDEAQNIEEVAADHLGSEVSNTGLNYILGRIYNSKKNSGVHRQLNISQKDSEQFIDGVVAVKETANVFFTELLSKFGTDAGVDPVSGSRSDFIGASSNRVKRLREPNIIENPMGQPLVNLSEILKRFRFKTDNEEIQVELKSYASRLLVINNNLNAIISQSYSNYVYWIEILSRRRGIKIVLYAAPVDVAPILKETVFDKTSPIILTSATLAIDKRPARPQRSGWFDFIKERLGLDTPGELLLDSPFDYKTQVLLYISEDMPDPKYEPEKFNKKSIEEIEKIIKITQGRTFCLFTSYRMLNDIYGHLSTLNEYKIFKQGEIPKWQMLTGFKKHKNAVLLGTDTFWQGVDVPGKALECVIITRLPFAVPDEPLVEAKMEYLEKQGRDPFIHYQIPHAIIMFKQGFGRLIRHKKDIGIVAVLDPRIKTRGYGAKFFNSLPECRNVSTIDELKDGYSQFVTNKE